MTDNSETNPTHLSQPFAWQDRDDLFEFCKMLDGDERDGANARLVGGVVRDALLGVKAADIDIATKLLPQKVIDLANSAGLSAIPTGIAHGTVTVILHKGPVEVTTLRRDVSTDGRHATIAFSDSWKEDAARRDFTFNALYVVPASGELYDYFAGRDDLNTGTVRFIGNARERILEDHLRIMRYFRFNARYGQGPLDDKTLKICAELAPQLQGLSRERIAQELLRLLIAPQPISTFQSMDAAGLWQYIIPDMADNGIVQLESTLERGKIADVTPSAMTRLAALLPPTQESARKTAAALRLSRKQQNALSLLCSPDPLHDDDALGLAYYHGPEMALQMVLFRGNQSALHKAKEFLTDWEKPTFPINGHDIINAGVEPGPLISRLIQSGEKQWLKQGCPEITDKKSYIASLAASHGAR